MAPDEDEILILIVAKKFELSIRDVCQKVRFQIAEMRARRRECQARSERWAAGRLHRRRGSHWAPANNARKGAPSYYEGYRWSLHALSISVRTRARTPSEALFLYHSVHTLQKSSPRRPSWRLFPIPVASTDEGGLSNFSLHDGGPSPAQSRAEKYSGGVPHSTSSLGTVKIWSRRVKEYFEKKNRKTGSRS